MNPHPLFRTFAHPGLDQKEQSGQVAPLFVGHLKQRKGTDTLFDALDQIMPDPPGLHV
jgi:hypothetical protein